MTKSLLETQNLTLHEVNKSNLVKKMINNFNPKNSLFMKRILLTSILLFAFAITGFSQQNPWSNWNWLLGEWQGEGSGQPGQGDGTFSFTFELDKKVIVRKSSTEFPATDSKPKSVYEDLMVVYLDYTGNPSKAIYFNSEGHTINYSISYRESTIILISEKIPNGPIFRLTYTLIDDNTVNTKFEMSMDGEQFFTHIEGNSKKIKW
jgi:hypothetical protein